MLVVTQPPAVLEHLVRGRRHEQRLVQRLGEFQRQPQISLHVLQRMLAVLKSVVYDYFSAVYEIRAVDVGDCEDFEDVGQ